MLGVRTYTKEYIDACRSRLESDVSAYRNLAGIASLQASDKSEHPAVEAFEAAFFNNLVCLLDYYFVHRLRVVEGKDGNAMNEVRVLCNSMLDNGNILTADKSIKLSPAKSILKYQFGDEIKLNEADFSRLAEAFFAELESRFLESD